jgi:hypothetical protein
MEALKKEFAGTPYREKHGLLIWATAPRNETWFTAMLSNMSLATIMEPKG